MSNDLKRCKLYPLLLWVLGGKDFRISPIEPVWNSSCRNKFPLEKLSKDWSFTIIAINIQSRILAKKTIYLK
jgi:hypothetical protein